MRPKIQRQTIFNARWTNPACRKEEVTNRQYCPPNVEGPKSAPQAKRCADSGEIGEIPRATMATKTPTLMEMRRIVAKGQVNDVTANLGSSLTSRHVGGGEG